MLLLSYWYLQLQSFSSLPFKSFHMIQLKSSTGLSGLNLNFSKNFSGRWRGCQKSDFFFSKGDLILIKGSFLWFSKKIS